MTIRKTPWILIPAIICIGIVCIVAAYLFRQSLCPEPVPLAVQESGEQLLREALAQIHNTEFGQSKRGQLLSARTVSMLEHNRVIFSADLKGTRAMWCRELVGPEIWYIKVIEMNDNRYLHQMPCQIIEGVFHEAVHSIHGGFRCSGIEEECDAFAAGLCAEAAVKGIKPPELLNMDGMPVAEFVVKSYPDLPRDPEYQPIGQSLEWLKQITGLD